jgi:hypothetical protein
MAQNLIMQEWRKFSLAVMPKGASAVQVQEMRRAFFGGAAVMLRLITEIGAPGVAEENGVAILDGCLEECRDFSVGLLNGKY